MAFGSLDGLRKMCLAKGRFEKGEMVGFLSYITKK